MWSRKFNQCKWCETKEKKHKGKGLCLNCYDIYRLRNPKRKEKVKQQKTKWYLKFKITKEYKEKYKLNYEKRKNTLSYKKYMSEDNNYRQKYRYFLNKQKKFDKRHNGIEIVINGLKVKTPIKELQNNKDLLRFDKQIKIFKEIYKTKKN